MGIVSNIHQLDQLIPTWTYNPSRRTLEKLRNEHLSAFRTRGQAQDGPSGQAPGSSEDDASPQSVFQDTDEGEASPGLPVRLEDVPWQTRDGTEYSNEVSPRPRNSTHLYPEISHQSGTATPWKPHNLIMNGDGGNQMSRLTLGRKLLHILGEFPIEDDGNDNGAKEAKGLQDPLWLMAGLADRGWDLDGGNGNGKRPKHPISLTSSSLPEEDARLLSMWTSKALREIEKEQQLYFKHGLFGSKLDVSHDLDPIQHGLITIDKANKSFQM